MFLNINCKCRYGCLLLLLIIFTGTEVSAITDGGKEVAGPAMEYNNLALLETINNTVVSETVNLEILKARLQNQNALNKAASIQSHPTANPARVISLMPWL